MCGVLENIKMLLNNHFVIQWVLIGFVIHVAQYIIGRDIMNSTFENYALIVTARWI